MPFCTLRIVAPRRPRGYPQNPKSVGERIRKIRMDLGLSQKALGRALGVSELSVSMWERDRKRPQPHRRERFLAVLGYDAELPIAA